MVVILVGDMSSCPYLHFYQVSSKYCEGYSSYRLDMKSNSKQEEEITPKVRKPELSFLYAKCCLLLFYISTKCIEATEQTQNQIQTQDGEITPKVRKPELSFLYATTHLVLFFISTKNHQNIPKGIRVIDTKSISKTKQSVITPKVRNMTRDPWATMLP